MRKKQDLAHELTIAWYRAKRHESHPLRKEVGDPYLPNSQVIQAMRSGKDKKFQFWRDLRPPFSVTEVRRLGYEQPSRHPEGELHEVTVQCGIDYGAERLWNTSSVNGTYDNQVHTVVKCRIPDTYPRRRPLVIVNWGQPTLNFQADTDKDEDGNPLKPVFIDPAKWMPISEELQTRADLPRFARCREATRKADSRRGLETKPLQKLLLGPHQTLARLAAIDHDTANMTEAQKQAAAEKLAKETGQPPPRKVKPKERRIFTAAAGFVRYAG